MKKRVLALLPVICCLLLSACGGKSSISGEVVEIVQTDEATALVLKTDTGAHTAVFLDDDLSVWGMEEMDGDAYKSAPHTGVSLLFYPKGRGVKLTTAGGETMRAYHARDSLRIFAYRTENAAVLSDGTALEVWKSGWQRGNVYRLPDGTQLLRESLPSGPENHAVGDLEGFGALSEAAQTAVRQYFAQQGTLYDLQGELERAWAEYRQNPEGFSTHFVSQDTVPAASGAQVMYFNTVLTLPVEGNICKDTTFCAAFDRRSGKSIPLEALFTCPKEEIGERLLTLAEGTGSAPQEPEVLAEMAAAFRMEYLAFERDCIVVTFPAGTLPSQECTYLISVDYDAVDILQPWAVPAAGDAAR